MGDVVAVDLGAGLRYFDMTIDTKLVGNKAQTFTQSIGDSWAVPPAWATAFSMPA